MTNLLTPVTLPTLRATPSVLRAMVEGVPEDLRQAAPAPGANAGEWSITTVVAHLIDGHRRQVERIRLLVEQEHPALQNVDEWESMEASGLLGQPTDELLATLAELRAADVPRYAGLTPEQLGRSGRHSVGGEVTVANILNHAAYHDAQHTGQIARLIEVAAHAGRGNMGGVDI
ncbi:MAG: DinB family protein [Dehalococcoidia bacterium]